MMSCEAEMRDDENGDMMARSKFQSLDLDWIPKLDLDTHPHSDI